MANDVEKRITAKYILDDSGFNDKLQGINQQLTLNRSELKNAQVGMQTFGKTSDSLKSVQQALATQIETQSKKVDIYRQSIEKVSTKMKENITERDRLKASLEQENAKLDGAIQAYGKESAVAIQLKEKINDLTEEYNKKQKAVESNAKSINNYTINMNKANAELIKTQGELNKTTGELNKSNSGWIKASDVLKNSSGHFKSIGEGANNAGNKILGMTAPLVGFGVAAAKVGMDFDSQMSRVKAISGATGEEFQKLNDQAIKLGADTAFSATEAAQGMENLASAGFSTNEIMAAMPGMLDLAASSGENLASSADIAASTLRGFGIEASQAGHVADVLAKNASATNAAVADTGEAMKYVAPVAHAMGLSLEEVTASIGIMANAGIKGSDAGTALRGSLVRLASPSKEASDMMKQIGFNAFDTQGKMLPLNEIITRLQKSTSNLKDEQKQNAIATIFGTESLSGMLALVQAGPKQLNDLTQGLKNSNGAASDMAKTMQDNAKSSIEQMFGSLETAGIKLEQSFAPTIRKIADSVGNLADKFANLSPSTQTAIVDAVGLTVAVGGTLKVVGGLASSIGGVVGLLGKFSGGVGAAKIAVAEVGTAATVAEGAAGVGGIAGLGAGLGTLAVAAAPWLIAAGAVAGAGYLIYKGMNEQAIPAVDLFADKINKTNSQLNLSANNAKTNVVKISAATKQAVGAYINMDDGVKKSLTDLYINGNIITAQTVQTLVQKYNDMGTQIKTGMDNHYNQEYSTMQQFFQKSSALSTTEEANVLANLQKSNTNKKAEIDNYTKQIQQILQNAANNNREITSTEQQQINAIQEKMKTQAIKTLSANEVEANVIMDRIKEYGTRITTEQASEIIKNAETQRQGSVDAANRQFEETKAAIANMKNTVPGFTQEMADKLIADAERQRKDSIQKANELKEGVVEKIQDMNREVGNSVDSEDGHVLTIWERWKNWWANWHPETKTFSAEVRTPTRMGGPSENWTGTNYFDGGFTTLNERGYELYDLPRGTRIFNHDASEVLVTKTAEDVATKVANSMLSGLNIGSNSGGQQTIIVPVQLDGKTIAQVIAPYTDRTQGNNLRLSQRGLTT